MTVVLWPRYWWQIAAALLLSVLGFFLRWKESPVWRDQAPLGWLATVGHLVTLMILQVSEFRLFSTAIAMGFVANVAFLTFVLILATRLVTRVKGGA